MSFFGGLGIAAALSAPASLEIEDLGAVELRWRAPESCPRAAQVRASALQDAPPLDEGHPLTFRVEAEVVPRTDGRFDLQAITASATGRQIRDFVVDDCDTAASVVALLVATNLETARSGEAQPIAPAPVPEPVRPAPAPRPTPIAPAPVPRPQARPRARPDVALRLSAGVEFGGLPNIGPGFALSTVVAWPSARLDIRAAAFTPRIVEASSGDVAASVQMATAAVRGCGRFVRRRIEVPLCGGAELGAVTGRGIGIDDPRRDTILWAAILVATGLVVRVHPRAGLMLEFEAATPLGSPEFVIDGAGAVYRGRVGGRALFGVEVWLGRPRTGRKAPSKPIAAPR